MTRNKVLASVGLLALIVGISLLVRPNKKVKVSAKTKQEVRKKPQQTTPGKTEILHNPGGGDCLFYCFNQVMNVMGADVSIRKLRKVVADAATEEQLQTLKSIYSSAVKEQEYALTRDYSFMEGVGGLKDLKRALMRSSYWGDEMAVRALEQRSGMRALIFTVGIGGRPQLVTQIDSTSVPSSGIYIMLLLQNQHYELIKYGGLVYFTKDQLPRNIQKIIE